MMEKETLYTWEEIRDFLIKELKKTKHIMTFGTIGSCNIEHDIDIIITKKPKSKTSDFFKEIHGLWADVDNYLKSRYHKKLIVFSVFSHQEEIAKLGKWHKGDLLFHTMVYNSLHEIKIETKKFLKIKESPIPLLKYHYDLLKGKKSYLFSEAFSKENIYGNLYVMMYEHDRLKSNLPDKLLIKKMNELFNYILKKRLNIKPLKAKTKREVYETFYKTLDILDEKEKELQEDIKKNPYRHLISRDDARIYRFILKGVLQKFKPKNIGFVGVIFDDSKTKDVYLGTLILPKLRGKIGESLIELRKINYEVENALEKKGYNLSISPKKAMHQMIHSFSTTEEGEEGILPISIAYFPDYKSYRKIPPKTFFEEVKNNLQVIYGKFEIIKKLKNISQDKLEPYFFVLHSVLGTKIKTLSQKDEKAAIESLFEHLKQKYNLVLDEKIPENEKQKEQLFVKIMKKLDKRTYYGA